MQEVTLANGSIEQKGVVIAVTSSLRLLWNNGIPGINAVYELHQLCQDREYEVSPYAIEILQKISLMDPNGEIHDSLRNVVLSAIKGEGISISLGSPYAD